MTIAIPLTLPSMGPSGQSFELQRIDYMAPEANGVIGGVTAGFPLWKAEWDMGNISRIVSDQWRAVFTAARGMQRLFYGYDYARSLPINYIGGLPNGFSGAASSWSVSVDGAGSSLLTLNGLPSGLSLMPGDYVDFRWSTYSRALVRFLESATANGSGTLTGTIEPSLPVVVPGNAVAHLDNPCCLMRFTTESALGRIERRGAITGGRLVAVQAIIS